MKPAHTIFILAICLRSTLAVGDTVNNGNSCGRVPPRPQYSPPSNSTEGCVCGARLHNVLVPLTKSFRLKAACNLRWIDQIDTIDLSKERVSFERYKNGYIPYGELLLIGATTLRGQLRHSDGPAGEWWFHPEGTPIASRGPLVNQFESIKLTREHAQQEFHAPQSLQKADCWEAKAVVNISNIWLMIGGNDEAGAYPVKYSVTSVSNHRRCK